MLLEAPPRPRSTLFSILALWLLFYASFTLFTPPLLDDADSVHAEVAREMLLRHDYITLYANGIRYLEKAPLLYWSMALSFRLFGVSTAAARIPLAFTVLALALTVETFARRAFHSSMAGLYAALILLSSPGIFLFTRIIIPDAMVALWLTLAMLCFYLSEQQTDRSAIESRYLCYGFAACCALGVLTKGLIGVVFPVAIILAYLLVTRGGRGVFVRIRELHPLSSLAVFVLVAAPWHILIAIANPTQGHPGNLSFQHGHWQVPLPTEGNVHGWLWFYFVNEQLLRYLNLRVPRDYDTVPLWLFWGLCLAWLMPWSAFLFSSIATALPARIPAWRLRLRTGGLMAWERPLLLLVIWAAVPLFFFSFSTRQEYYVLPAIPAICLLLANWVTATLIRREDLGIQPALGGPAKLMVSGPTNPKEQRLRDPAMWAHNRVAAHKAALRGTAMIVAASGLFAAASLCFLLHTGEPVPLTDLSMVLQQNRADYTLSLGHCLDLNAKALSFFRPPLVIAAASLFLGTLASLLLRLRRRSRTATLALAAGALGFLVAVHLGLRTFAPILSSRQLAASVAAQLGPNDIIVIHQEYEFASTLAFYLRRDDLHILDGRSSNLWYGSFFTDAPSIFETTQTLAQRWRGRQRIFLWQDLASIPSPLPPMPGPIYVIARSGGKEIVSNQPDRP
jgi:4-amino-4-deoxy-L-arabinose transferase-like glycosyltransferase